MDLTHFAYTPTSPSGLTWAIRRAGVTLGAVAGTQLASGHWQVQLNGRFIRTYHIVLALHGVEIPKGMVVDHVDGNTSNNTLENLRVVTQQVNTHNRTARGVTYEASRCKYKAAITVNYKTIFLGRFDDFDTAHNAYLEAKRTYHPTAPERIFNGTLS